MNDLMRPVGITQKELASELRTSFRTINEILNGKSAIYSDMTLRLSKYFGTSFAFWLNAQKHYDLQKAWQKNKDVITWINRRKAA